MITENKNPDNPDKLAFFTRCLPGSPAEQKEKEKMAEFQKAKAEREAEEARTKPERDERRRVAHAASRPIPRHGRR